LQTVHCGTPKTLESFVSHPGISSIAFTGSVSGGIAVQKAAASRVVPVGLELGGKDPAYVRPDVNLVWAAENIVDGAIFNSGQSCCSIERVYVHESIYDDFLKEVVKVLEGYKLGDPLDKSTQIGPVVSVKSAKTISEHIKDAEAKGAVNLTPELVFAEGVRLGETFVRPELLAECDHSMRIMTEETFGPTIPVMRVSNDEEAIKLMNDSQFGLTASIWTKDIGTGEKLVERVEAGTVFVNRCDYPSPVRLRPLFPIIALWGRFGTLLSSYCCKSYFMAVIMPRFLKNLPFSIDAPETNSTFGSNEKTVGFIVLWNPPFSP